VAIVSNGCTGTPANGAIVLYSGQHPQLTAALVAAFTKETGIEVSTRTNDSIVLAQQILQEGTGSPADVYLAENSPELTLLENHGLIQRLPSAILSQVPLTYSSPASKWVGMALRVSCLAYNQTKTPSDRLPSSILDLANPDWVGRIGIAPSDSDFVPIVGAVIAVFGEARAQTWLEGLKRNAVIYQDIEAVVSSVNHGDVAAGLINQYYWYRLRLEIGAASMRSTIYYFPNGDAGSIENIAGAAILAHSPHLSQAVQFVSFIVSKEGQQILASGDDFEYPLRADVTPSAQLPLLSTIQTSTISFQQLGDDQGAARLILQVGLL
jgi:iron(III) transport system substrate-binding protein